MSIKLYGTKPHFFVYKTTKIHADCYLVVYHYEKQPSDFKVGELLHNFRFNLDRAEDRKAWETLHSERVEQDFKSQNRFVIRAVNDYYERHLRECDAPFLYKGKRRFLCGWDHICGL